MITWCMGRDALLDSKEQKMALTALPKEHNRYQTNQIDQEHLTNCRNHSTLVPFSKHFYKANTLVFKYTFTNSILSVRFSIHYVCYVLALTCE